MMFGFLNSIFDNLNDWSLEWWFIGVVFIIALLDSVIPVVPSETTVIIGGVAAGTDNNVARLLLVIAAGASGAFCGDNMAYQIGRRAEPFLRRKFFSGDRERRLVWAEEQIAERGGLLLITARFIPGGRTLLTLSCGITRQPLRWFVRYISIAVVIWASYAALLGFIGGKTFSDNHTMAFLVAFGLALSVTGIIELVRHLRKKKAGAH
jgi:membrane-associated protein